MTFPFLLHYSFYTSILNVIITKYLRDHHWGFLTSPVHSLNFAGKKLVGAYFVGRLFFLPPRIFSSPTPFSSHKWGEPQKVLPQNRLPSHQTKKRASPLTKFLTPVVALSWMYFEVFFQTFPHIKLSGTEWTCQHSCDMAVIFLLNRLVHFTENMITLQLKCIFHNSWRWI